jgi:two-component system, OmpR family, response regulator ResD
MSYLDKVFGKDTSEDPKNKKPEKPPIKVLFVEDEAVLREMYRDKLAHEGFDVIIASNGKDGLESAISHKPDLILLDLMMPVMDGITMLRKLREIPEFKKLPVIVLTNAGEIENIKQTQRYENASEFLIKSNVSMDDVVKKIKEWTLWGFR